MANFNGKPKELDSLTDFVRLMELPMQTYHSQVVSMSNLSASHKSLSALIKSSQKIIDCQSTIKAESNKSRIIKVESSHINWSAFLSEVQIRKDIKFHENNPHDFSIEERYSSASETSQQNINDDNVISPISNYLGTIINPPSRSSPPVARNENSRQVNRRKKRGKYDTHPKPNKEKAISYSKLHGTKEAARKFGIAEKSIKRWVEIGIENKGNRGRKKKDPQMEIKLTNWIKGCLSKPCRKEIMDKAIEWKTSTNFKASKGWYDKFMRNFYKNNANHSSGTLTSNTEINNIIEDSS